MLTTPYSVPRLAWVALTILTSFTWIQSDAPKYPWLGSWVVNMPQSTNINLEDVPDSSHLHFTQVGDLIELNEDGRDYRGRSVHRQMTLNPGTGARTPQAKNFRNNA